MVRADLIIFLKATFEFGPPCKGTGRHKFELGLRQDDIMSAVAKKISSEGQYYDLIVNFKIASLSLPAWPFANAEKAENAIVTCLYLYRLIHQVLYFDLNCTIYKAKRKGKYIKTLVGLKVRAPSSTDGPADALNK